MLNFFVLGLISIEKLLQETLASDWLLPRM